MESHSGFTRIIAPAGNIVGTVVKALVAVTGIGILYKAFKFTTGQHALSSRVEDKQVPKISEHALLRENARLRASVDEYKQNLRRIRQPFQFICDDLMAHILEFLYMEELCSLLGTSSWFQSHPLNALQRRKVVLPDVLIQKWGKSSSVSLDEMLSLMRWRYRTNFEGRDERKWCSEYVASIARHCKNVEEVESGFLSMDRLLVERSYFLCFEEFLRGDVEFLINRCSKITHIDGIIGLRVAELGKITAHQISVKALILIFDSHWMSNVDEVHALFQKCVRLEHLELIDGSSDDQHVSLGELLATVLPKGLPRVKSLKVTKFSLCEADVDSVVKCFPNLSALAINMELASCNFLKSFLSVKRDALDVLDLECEKLEDLHHLKNISNAISAREVVIKELKEGTSMWKPEYVLHFPRARKLTVAFWSDGNFEKTVTGYDFHHPEQLYSRYSFGADQAEKDYCDYIGHIIRENAPWVETLHVAFVDRTNLPKFGLHERYSPGIEKRALGLMRGANILHDLPKKKVDEYDMQATDEQLSYDDLLDNLIFGVEEKTQWDID